MLNFLILPPTLFLPPLLENSDHTRLYLRFFYSAATSSLTSYFVLLYDLSFPHLDVFMIPLYVVSCFLMAFYGINDFDLCYLLCTIC